MPVGLSASMFQFGNFELDCSRFELRQSGNSLRVERKPMELLILLVSREGRVVTREEIAQRLWSSEVFVDTEHGINTAIRKLRYLLHDDSDNPKFIQTVTGVGYRFIACVTTVQEGTAATLPGEEAMPDFLAEETPEPAHAAASHLRPRSVRWYGGAGACLVLAFGGLVLFQLRHRLPEVAYTQLTDFTDSAVTPALSPDGHMVAFIRGADGFLTSDQIYVKMLPNGEARRITEDGRLKYGLAFSPDGSDISYTVFDGLGFATYEVSVLGGEPHLLLKNAAGLAWLDSQRVLFSEIRTGIHMGMVTATVTREGLREIYFPPHERGMAHYSFPSPDRRRALVVEMNGNGEWTQCVLVDLLSQSPPKSVGPTGSCTSAGWSPDGSWMYFTAGVGGRSHIWRQRFPEGGPEQITFGPTEENGLAVEPAGQALIASVGVHERAIWIHDGANEHPLSSEGEVLGELMSPPVFSPDGSILYYLLRRGEGSGAELWRMGVESDKSEAVFPEISINSFDISPDGKQVVYTTPTQDGTTELWVAPVDRSKSATRMNVPGATSPHFGANGELLFLRAEGNVNYLERISSDGSRRSKVFEYSIIEFQGVSPNRQWVMVSLSGGEKKDLAAITAIPLDGGSPRRICASYCIARWSTDGRFLFVAVEESSRTSPGRSLAIRLGPGESLPGLQVAGIPLLAEASVVRGAESIGHAVLVPGKDPEHYAWINTTVHCNLYLISLH